MLLQSLLKLIIQVSRLRVPSTRNMFNISSVRYEPLQESDYVKPLRMRYVQDGVEKIWDMIQIHESVSVLMYNVPRKVLVLVKQFRPAVFYSNIQKKHCSGRGSVINDISQSEIEQGFTLELCSGIVDKDVSLEEIAKIEMLEECGYDVPLSNLKRILTYRSGVGVSGDKQTLFYAEVDDSMRVSQGGGNPKEGEMISVVELSIADAKKYLESGDVLSPGGFLFALHWFFHTKDSI